MQFIAESFRARFFPWCSQDRPVACRYLPIRRAHIRFQNGRRTMIKKGIMAAAAFLTMTTAFGGTVAIMSAGTASTAEQARIA
jgi:hypothetical protein